MPKTSMHAILHLIKGAAEDNVPFISTTPLICESGVFLLSDKNMLQHMERMYIFSFMHKI